MIIPLYFHRFACKPEKRNCKSAVKCKSILAYLN
jgi:hypothetical protein